MGDLMERGLRAAAQVLGDFTAWLVAVPIALWLRFDFSTPPGGWDNWEFATDITASFMGFGVFMANTAFRFRQYGGAGVAGWQTSGGGYLSQAEHSFALALFLRLKDIPASAALPHCDPNVRGFLKRALADLDDSDAIASLRQVVPVD